MMDRLVVVVLVGLIVALTVPVRVSVSAGERPHLVFVLADDLRADLLSVYGGPVATPHLEQLAERGCRFERATCGYPICHVSRTEILSGRSVVAEATPGRVIRFPDEWTLWPEWMTEHGWRTVHAGKWHVNGQPHERGYARTAAMYSSGGGGGKPVTLPVSSSGHAVTGYTGWTFKTDASGERGQPLPEWGIGLMPDTDLRIADGAIREIQGIGEERLCLHVNFTAPHDPLHWPAGRDDRYRAEQVELPANFRSSHPFDHGNAGGRDEVIIPAPRSTAAVQTQLAVYYALAENLDIQVGRIVAALEARGMLDKTILIFSSDQGMAVGSHGLMGKQNQYEHTANVPLILAGPGVPAGMVVSENCALRSVYPTVCDLVGIPIPKSVEANSLVPLLGEGNSSGGAAYGYYTDTQRMIRKADGWKLIWYPQLDRVQLFETATDPAERDDVSRQSQQAPRVKRMLAELKRWLSEHADPVVQP